MGIALGFQGQIEQLRIIISNMCNHEDFEIALAPGPNEVIASKKFDAIIVTNNNVALNIMELGGLINKASYIISNDTWSTIESLP